MGLFRNDKEIVYPFSGFEIQLFYKGKPAAQAKIIRQYKIVGEGDFIKENVVADKEGRFVFESVSMSYREPLLSAVGYMSHQSIYAHYNNEDFHIWEATRMLKEEFSEFDGKASTQVKCELTDEAIGIALPLGRGLFVTSCVWDVKEKEEKE